MATVGAELLTTPGCSCSAERGGPSTSGRGRPLSGVPAPVFDRRGDLGTMCKTAPRGAGTHMCMHVVARLLALLKPHAARTRQPPRGHRHRAAALGRPYPDRVVARARGWRRRARRGRARERGARRLPLPVALRRLRESPRRRRQRSARPRVAGAGAPAPSSGHDGAVSAAVDLVIPNLDGEALLPACLAGVAAQTLAPVRVIVVDNGSADGSRAIAEAHGAEWHALAGNRGF